jgi:HPt (histidine-containing phosphotransfer) domain-containing protein
MNVKQFYIDINGSYENALAIMMNDALISRMLTKFMDNNAFEQIISSYEQKDYRSLFAVCHTYKGITGNLALTPLYDISCVLTEATRNSDGVNLDKEMEELKKQYNLIRDSYNRNIAG